MNILLKNIDIITADSENKFIKNGSIGIKDGIIEFINPLEYELNSFSAQK